MVAALASIQRDLGASLETLEWTVSAFSLTAAGFIITAAALGDRLGRARVFTTGLALFAMASAVCAVAPGPAVLIAGRSLQGLSAAAWFDHSDQRVSPGASGRSGWFLGRSCGAGWRQRTADGRSHRSRTRLALDLLGQSADRAGRDDPFNRPAARELRVRDTHRCAGADTRFGWGDQWHGCDGARASAVRVLPTPNGPFRQISTSFDGSPGRRRRDNPLEINGDAGRNRGSAGGAVGSRSIGFHVHPHSSPPGSLSQQGPTGCHGCNTPRLTTWAASIPTDIPGDNLVEGRVAFEFPP